jgi:hypothetical protein
MMRSGSWFMESKSDPRWNASGRSSMVGMFQKPAEVTQKIEDLRSRLGCEPPDDLEWGYEKD